MFHITSFCTKLTKYKFRLNIVALIKKGWDRGATCFTVLLSKSNISYDKDNLLTNWYSVLFFLKALFLSLKFLDLNYFNLKSFNLNWFFVRFSRNVISNLCVRDQVWLGGVCNGLISEIRLFLPDEVFGYLFRFCFCKFRTCLWLIHSHNHMTISDSIFSSFVTSPVDQLKINLYIYYKARKIVYSLTLIGIKSVVFKTPLNIPFLFYLVFLSTLLNHNTY